MKVAGAVVAIVLAVTGLARAQSGQLLVFSGYAWESGGYPPSAAGDDLNIVGLPLDVGPPLVWDPSIHSYTLWIRDLISLSEAVFGTYHVVEYAGGLFTLYEDSLPSNHDYGFNPPNATSPSTFMDGTSTYLEGAFLEFVLAFDEATTSGSIDGFLMFTGGDAFALLSHLCWIFDANVATVTPEGYDLQVEGSMLRTTGGCPSVPVPSQSWGGIKGLYR